MPVSLPRVIAMCMVLCLALTLSCSGKKNGSSADDGLPDCLQVVNKGLVEDVGGKERTLVATAEGAYVNGASISPDSKRLAFVLQPPAATNAKGDIDFGADLYVANRDGSNRKEVVHHASNGEFIFNPTWLPDGTGLVYVVRGRDELGVPDFRLESVDIASGKRTRLIEHAVEAAVSPDGKHVAYIYYAPSSQEPEQFLINEMGSKAPPRLLVPPDSGLLLIQAPRFSPDGKVIAFAASNNTVMAPSPRSGGLLAAVHPTLQDVYVVNADGTGLRKLAEIVESQPSIDWSPDGKYVYALGGGGFWKVDASTGEHEQIGPGEPGGIIRILKPSQ